MRCELTQKQETLGTDIAVIDIVHAKTPLSLIGATVKLITVNIICCIKIFIHTVLLVSCVLKWFLLFGGPQP